MNTFLISLGIATFSISAWAAGPATRAPHTATALHVSAYSTETTAASRHVAMQQRWLFRPSRQQLERERKGAITIYDGMSDRQVELAFDKAFDRIDYMMFVNVRKTGADGEILTNPQTGAPVTFDDGC